MLVPRLVAFTGLTASAILLLPALAGPAEELEVPEILEPVVDPPLVDVWAPPPWHPEPEALEVLAAMDATGPEEGPVLSARAVFVHDLDAGEVLLERAADERLPVASLTKLTAGLALASAETELDAVQCVDDRFFPGRPGARSRMQAGTCYETWELLGASMVSSDNHAAFGLQVASGLTFEDFIDQMDRVSLDLGMEQSTWADPSGLADNNLSTARDMARAVVAVSLHPDLSVAASAPFWDLVTAERDQRSTLFTTNRLAARQDLEVLAAKTGYTHTAGYCYTAVLRTRAGRHVALTILGAPRPQDRWRDVERLVAWVDQV